MIQSKLKFDKTKTQAKSQFSNTVEIENQKSNQTETKFYGLIFCKFYARQDRTIKHKNIATPINFVLEKVKFSKKAHR